MSKGNLEKMRDQEQSKTMKMQAVIEKYKTVTQEVSSFRTMLHNGRYLLILLMVAVVAAVARMPKEIGLVAVIWMPIPFLFLHWLHIFESYCYLQNLRYLVRILEPRMAELAGDKKLFMPLPHKAPWLMRVLFQGVSSQLLYLLPVIGTLMWWLHLHKGEPWKFYQIITIVFETAGLVVSILGWAKIGREYKGF